MYENLISGAAIAEIKAAGDGKGWEVAGYASTFGGEPDQQGDVIARGAFQDSIAKRQTKLFWQHREPIGVQLALHEDEKGLFGRWSILPTSVGTDAHALTVAGAIDRLSIGFRTVDAEFRDDGVRIVKVADLYEVSLVAIPANDNAVVTAVKNSLALCLAGNPADGRPAGPCLGCLSVEQRAAWTAAYINDLPDAAFAVIEGGGKKGEDGRTEPRSLRHLPHHDEAGKLDLPHLKSAMARLPQTKISDAMKNRAAAHLSKHAEASGVSKDAGFVPDHDGGDGNVVQYADHAEATLNTVEHFLGRSSELANNRLSDARKLSDAHLNRFRELRDGFSGLVDMQEALRAPSVNVMLELTRRRLRAARILEE